MDQEDLDNPIMKTASELLLSSATDGVDLRTVDPETQARLEALLEAAGMTGLSERNSAVQNLLDVDLMLSYNPLNHHSSIHSL